MGFGSGPDEFEYGDEIYSFTKSVKVLKDDDDLLGRVKNLYSPTPSHLLLPVFTVRAKFC